MGTPPACLTARLEGPVLPHPAGDAWLDRTRLPPSSRTCASVATCERTERARRLEARETSAVSPGVGGRRGRGLGRPALTGASLSQPEVLHMIYLRALQIVYGTRLEHFYMVGSPPPPAASREFLTKSKAYVKLTSFTEEPEA